MAHRRVDMRTVPGVSRVLFFFFLRFSWAFLGFLGFFRRFSGFSEFSERPGLAQDIAGRQRSLIQRLATGILFLAQGVSMSFNMHLACLCRGVLVASEVV